MVWTAATASLGSGGLGGTGTMGPVGILGFTFGAMFALNGGVTLPPTVVVVGP